MSQRWIPGIVIGLGLFVINVAARIAVNLTGQGADPDGEFTIGLYATIAMGAAALVAGLWGAVRKPFDRIVAEIGPGLLAGVLLSVLLGPLVVGANPFGGGFEPWFIQLSFFLVVTLGGAFLGYLLTMMFGVDHKSKSLKRVESHYGRAVKNRR